MQTIAKINNNKTNIIAIDIVRAIAALGVFSYHQHIGELIDRFAKIHLFSRLDSFGAFYAVPLFFLISGYCIHLSNLKYVRQNISLPLKLYYKRRFLRIYPPYLAAVVFSVLVIAVTGYGKLPTLQDSIVHFFCVQGFSAKYFNTINLVLWTITIEISFYIIYPIFFYFRLKYSLNAALLVVLAVSSLSLLYFSLLKSVTLPQYYFVLNIWFSWCSGAFIADKLYFDSNSLKKPVYKLVYLLILILFVCCLIFQSAYYSVLMYQLKILIWTGPLVYLLSKEVWLKKQKSIFITLLVFIGLSSYSLYLLHEPLIAIKNYLVHEYLPSGLKTAGLIVGTVLIPIFAWFNYNIVEKPFIKLGK